MLIIMRYLIYLDKYRMKREEVYLLDVKYNNI